MSPVSNEYILDTLAQVAATLAGFSGLVVVFRVRGAQAWSRAELRTFWFLLGRKARHGFSTDSGSWGVSPLRWMSWSDYLVRHQ